MDIDLTVDPDENDVENFDLVDMKNVGTNSMRIIGGTEQQMDIASTFVTQPKKPSIPNLERESINVDEKVRNQIFLFRVLF